MTKEQVDYTGAIFFICAAAVIITMFIFFMAMKCCELPEQPKTDYQICIESCPPGSFLPLYYQECMETCNRIKQAEGYNGQISK